MRKISILLGLWTLLGCASFQREHLVCAQTHDDQMIASLMKRACHGDRHTQYQLGVMFDDGEGVSVDYELAATYFALAAAPSSGQSYIYVPGAGKVPGHVMRFDTGKAHPGLADAKYRLALMYQLGRGVKQDHEEAEKLLTAAARQGVVDEHEDQ